MTALNSERALASVAAVIAGSTQLSAAEQRLVRGPRPDIVLVNIVRGFIKAGMDPLGEAFEQIRSAELRRKLGAVYTPPAIVNAMVRWAAKNGSPARVVDPGAGSGRYLAAAAARWPKAQLIACEIDPLAALIIRANAAVSGFSQRLTIHVCDYREMPLPAVQGQTLFLGNPPYVRHHDIEASWKEWFKATSKKFGFHASALAGLHAHFFLRTRELARRGDYGSFITSAEWLDVNYGSTIREMLGNGLGGASLHLLDARSMPFGNTMTTGAITCFEVGSHHNGMSVQVVGDLKSLNDLDANRIVEWGKLQAANRWSILVKDGPPRQPGMIQIGDLFRVHRGQVTGTNRVWVEGQYKGELPQQFLRSTVTKAREIMLARGCLSSTPKELRRVLFLPRELDLLGGRDRELVEHFLTWAKALGAHETFTARARKPWWSVGLKTPPAILSTYMARRAPAFVRNDLEAQYINIALGLYPKIDLSPADLDAIVQYLERNICVSAGRVYAGGLVKFEPKELESVQLPSLETLHEIATQLEHRANRASVEGVTV